MKPSLFDLTQEQKSSFYSQESFDNPTQLKKYLRYAVILIVIIEIIRTSIEEFNEETAFLDIHQRIIFYITLIIGVSCFLLSSLKYFEHKTFTKFSWRASLLYVSALGFCVAIFLRTFWSVTYVLEEQDLGAWLDFLVFTPTSIFLIVLGSVIYPHWFLKLSLPVCFFIGILVPVIQDDPAQSFRFIFRIITSGLYIFVLYILKDYMRWQLFLKKMEDQTWKALQMKIMEEIPTSIAIMDIYEEKVIYSNKEFQKFSGRSIPEEFFNHITNLTQRKEKDELCKSLDSDIDIAFHSYRSMNLEPPASSLRSPSAEDHMLSSPQGPHGLARQFSTLNEILKRFSRNYKLQSKKKPSLNVYDGTYSKNKEEPQSFEVKISCVAEHAQAIIMMNNTTQRDLIVSLTSNNKFKDNLLASISHELRTPLNGVLALLESAVTQHQDLNEVKRVYLEPALKSSRLLTHIVNDILDYSQLSSNTVGLALQDHSIIHTIKECYELTEFQVKKKGLQYTLSLDSNIPNTFITDHARVKQILLNLLSNAMKFTFEGEIRLEAQMNESNILTITVYDTGIGMTNEEKLKILHIFSATNSGEKITENSTGVGLGLTVSNRLAKLLGPSMTLDNQGIVINSEYGKGSSVSFQIQNRVPSKYRRTDSMITEGKDSSKDMFRLDNIITTFDEFPNEAYSPAMQLDNGRKYTFWTQSVDFRVTRRSTLASFRMSLKKIPQLPSILIVDDDPFNILALETLLKPFNLQSDSAYNGKEAIDKILKRNELKEQFVPNYTLVLMDFNMPIMNGHEATKRLVEMMQKKTIPQIKIVGCTAYNTKHDLETGRKSGMIEVMTKPVGKEKLIPVLQRYLGILQDELK